MTSNIKYPLTIYYDASCPLCKTEMEALKGLNFNNLLITIDCSNQNLETPTNCPITQEAMMERIYAVDNNGQWISGIDVFAVTYAASGFKKLTALLNSKKLRPLLEYLYPWFAKNRHWISKTPLPFLLNLLLLSSAKNAAKHNI